MEKTNFFPSKLRFRRDLQFHAVAENAGAIITTLDHHPFKYGKSDYKNLSLMIKRNETLDA